MLMYPDHLKFWLDFGPGLLIFLIWNSETGQIYGHFPMNVWKEWPEISKADVSCLF